MKSFVNLFFSCCVVFLSFFVHLEYCSFLWMDFKLPYHLYFFYIMHWVLSEFWIAIVGLLSGTWMIDLLKCNDYKNIFSLLARSWYLLVLVAHFVSISLYALPLCSPDILHCCFESFDCSLWSLCRISFAGCYGATS